MMKNMRSYNDDEVEVIDVSLQWGFEYKNEFIRTQ